MFELAVSGANDAKNNNHSPWARRFIVIYLVISRLAVPNRFGNIDP
jgi:hypothetical protein